jgi:DNA ligase-1
MLAKEYNPAEAKFPYLATPKIDGIRFYTHGGHCWSRSNKPIPNINIQRVLKSLLPDDVDGELFAGDSFNKTTSLVMSDCSPLEDTGLVVNLFDIYQAKTSYKDRATRLLLALRNSLQEKGWKSTKAGLTKQGHPFKIKFLFPVWICNYETVATYYETCLNAGYEGIILRVPESTYYFGRHKDMLKYKPYIDREAIILGCEEMMINTNEAKVNELGQSKRSSHASGMVPGNILGNLHVRDLESGIDFHVGGGPGLTNIMRAHLWAERHNLGGLVIKYRCFPYGNYEKPRQPQFIGFRDRRDM